MKRILEPSPVILPAAPEAPTVSTRPRRTLKRTASAASLPTPPRTTHKKRRKRNVDSDEEEEKGMPSEDELESSEDEKPPKPAPRALYKPKSVSKKATRDKKLTEEEAESQFWLGTPEGTASPEPKASKADKKVKKAPRQSEIRQCHLLRLEPINSSSSGGGQPLALPDGDEDGPIQDSPHNIFLTGSKAAHPIVPLAEEGSDIEQEPTVTYVFRGKRIEFPNPLYNLPPEAHERSKLPVCDPNFSPSPTIRPKRLFATEIAAATTGKRRRSPSLPSPSPSPTRPKRKATTIKKQRAVTSTVS
ncbi:SubName: Full=Uncharacterized protein {ECO:0000313/EMBL:CCA74718.1} [Serendipita indica DSM 11827]|nr:SubName: Full=Uncharacterized protein {ECO:0000313/EMBL:CCA74718.1} [Serendipita indica DSM 11827]